MANKKKNTKNPVAEEVSTPKRFKLNISKKTAMIAAALVIAVIVGLLLAGYIQAKNDLKKARDPQTAAQAEADEIIKDAGKFLELPKDEKPTTATVTEKEKLQEQPFFKNAENGDRVLIYSKAQRAILYRPSTKKVIEFAPVNLAAGDQSSSTNR